MKVYLTFDYELFFGKAGSVQKCILEPTERLVRICEKYGAKCVFFVDAGYLDRLRVESKRHPHLSRDRDEVLRQIQTLSNTGHDVQLHVHPHWEATTYDGHNWHFDLSRYRLDAFSDDAALDIFGRYISCITEATQRPVSAFRAGGWCIQPFAKFRAAFERFNIKVDSTVFGGGLNTTPSQWFDFTQAPDLDSWSFDSDPCRHEPGGRCLEIPIASYRLAPTFFWRFALTKLIKTNAHQSFGDGIAAANSSGQIARLLTRFSTSVVSADGYKTSFLKRAYQKLKQKGHNHFVVIGHPKALSEYALARLDSFLNGLDRHDEVKTFSTAV